MALQGPACHPCWWPSEHSVSTARFSAAPEPSDCNQRHALHGPQVLSASLRPLVPTHFLLWPPCSHLHRKPHRGLQHDVCAARVSLPVSSAPRYLPQMQGPVETRKDTEVLWSTSGNENSVPSIPGPSYSESCPLLASHAAKAEHSKGSQLPDLMPLSLCTWAPAGQLLALPVSVSESTSSLGLSPEATPAEPTPTSFLHPHQFLCPTRPPPMMVLGPPM